MLVFNGSDLLAVTGRDKGATWPSPRRKGTPIDEWCASAASNLWDDYVAAQAATRGFDGLRRYMPSALRDDEWHLIRMRIEARAALVTWLADSSGRGEIELWARPGAIL